LISIGFKWERKELTKLYDIPGYWFPAFSSSVSSEDVGPYGYGAGIYHSSDSLYTIQAAPSRRMPTHNIILTNDVGGYAQTIMDFNQFRFHLGVRADNNSSYGSSINPRLSTTYKFNNHKGVIKLVYAEAFQEPAPIQLFGGWSGRQSNPNLNPEKARNLELIGMYNLGPVLFDASVFYAKYDNVIKEEAENAGERTIYGVEVRTNYAFKNFIPKASRISGYVYYSYIKAMSGMFYDHNETDPNIDKWKEGEAELGDIAPHKINMGINLPLVKGVNLNVRGNYVSQRLVYLRNALRAKEYKIDEYFTLDGTISYNVSFLTLAIKVKNILDKEHFHPGPESASAGDDFSNRSLGYQNSVLPQAGRSYLVSATFRF
ncbi:MAG: TonB-dependent receptor, partial [Crocinitomicaceae bacterium]|nr:TonB-dependent receptor [Crocinitomicaceae bacterium]